MVKPQCSTRPLSINALRACVYIYIWHLSSFRVPTLLFIDLTVITCLACIACVPVRSEQKVSFTFTPLPLLPPRFSSPPHPLQLFARIDRECLHCRLLLAIFNTLFWVYATWVFFTGKWTKHENTQSTPFSYDRKLAADGYYCRCTKH